MDQIRDAISHDLAVYDHNTSDLLAWQRNEIVRLREEMQRSRTALAKIASMECRHAAAFHENNCPFCIAEEAITFENHAPVAQLVEVSALEAEG